LNIVNIEKKSKAIVIGRDIEIDGYANKLIRIVTHAHADHVYGLNNSLRKAKYIIATKPTLELIRELGYVNRDLIRELDLKSLPLDYRVEVKLYDYKLKLLPSTHILGSSQVVVEYNGYVIGYTSDFKMGGETEIINSPDILIIEATYGSPKCRRVFKNEVIDLLIDTVTLGLTKHDRVVIYGYYGKLQEVMKILRERGVNEPFIMNRKIYNITRIAEKYGWMIGDYYLENTREAYEVARSSKYIYFEHLSRAKYRRLNNRSLYIVLTGHEFREPIRRIDDRTWLIAFSDHADFDELIQYVELSKPRIIIVDNSREGYPEVFTEELRKRGWNAILIPQP